MARGRKCEKDPLQGVADSQILPKLYVLDWHLETTLGKILKNRPISYFRRQWRLTDSF